MHDAHFPSIEKLDTAILYLFELLSSLAILLLAFGLIASMANVLTEGSVLSDNLTMQRIWAWTQCVAIDASVAGTILRTFYYFSRREWVKACLSALLSALLLFTAAIVSNIEALQQTLNVTLRVAYAHVFVPVEMLIWIRSLCIVLLIVAHALRHVRPAGNDSGRTRILLSKRSHSDMHEQCEPATVLTEMPAPALPVPQARQGEQSQQHEQERFGGRGEQAEAEQLAGLVEEPLAISGRMLPGERTTPVGRRRQDTGNARRISDYLGEHPNASIREIARTLSLSTSTVSKWMKLSKQAEPSEPSDLAS